MPRAGGRSAGPSRVVYDRSVTDRLHFTESDEANALIASDPMALLVGFVLDQQVTVQKAFSGPLVLQGAPRLARRRRRSPTPTSSRCSASSPAIHRFPGSMAKRVHDLAVHVRDHYDGDAARVWTDAADADELRANLAALPGFGEMKIKALGAVLAKRFGVEAAEDLVPWHPTLGDVDSAQALADYQAAKRVHKAEWSRAAGALPGATYASQRSRRAPAWPGGDVRAEAGHVVRVVGALDLAQARAVRRRVRVPLRAGSSRKFRNEPPVA